MISAQDLTRSFKTKTETIEAVRGLSLDVAEGELVAFLGPNGAGKSTSVRLLTTLLPPDSGTATVGGHDIVSAPDAVRQVIGYVGQGTGLGQFHKVIDELITQGRALRMSAEASRKRAGELIEMLELGGLETRVGSALSGGQKRRVDIAIGLMHTPKILFLDEPTTGLDPQSRANLWEHIRRLRAATGMTIFLTTHYLDEADSQAERVMVMDHGRLIADDTPERLKAKLAGDRITLSLTSEDEASAAAAMAAQLPGARDTQRDGVTVSVTAERGDALLPEFIRRLHETGAMIATANVRRPTLDDVFLALTGRSLRDTAAA
jgi:ABC-2 type transport system ATP-binding protein